MSIHSGRTRESRLSSILKNTTIKSRHSLRTPTKVRFVLPHDKKVRVILENFKSGVNARDYENLVVAIRDSQLFDEDIHSLLNEATQCISLLGHELRLFVEALLCLEWANRGEGLVGEYQSFLLNLLSAHNYHAKFAIDQLVKNFMPGNEHSFFINCIY